MAAGKYGAWQSDLEATVGDDCSIVTHSIGMPEDDTYTYPAATAPNVSVASDGSITWNLKNGETAHMYPADIQVQWFIDFTGESTDPAANARRLLVYNSNGDIDLVFVGE